MPPLSRTTTRLSMDMKMASPNWPTLSTTTTASPHPRRSCSIRRQVSWMTSWVSSTSQKSRSSNNSWCRFVLPKWKHHCEPWEIFHFFLQWLNCFISVCANSSRVLCREGRFSRKERFCAERRDSAESWFKMDKPHWLTDPYFLI